MSVGLKALFVLCCLKFAVLFAASCWLSVVFLFVVCCVLCVVCRALLFVVYCLLFVVCCALFAV